MYSDLSSSQITPMAHRSTEILTRREAIGTCPTVLGDIYRDDTNIAVWERELPEAVQNAVSALIIEKPHYRASMNVTPDNVRESLEESLDPLLHQMLINDIELLVNMFCCLFDLKRAGLRLTVIDKAMCPRFHTDKVPCRLVTTYQNVATEWLPHNLADQSKLGMGSGGKPDNESGLFNGKEDIRQLHCFDVALLKGESWEGNEEAGLVHRSPAHDPSQSRLLLTLDFAD
ncbi:DUF1826 domain-containing protein [Enterovibrio sp. ZSDZ42]|uniref:DUF1826 domain-containing protein n=1 Tax=Enterovibrio gelatinilyticus TaxID=2899819 RepID=A0ABT5R0H3_9GAMM|nr:DUF1826 domain-containing protein [Enterovibrio sp. ZSDZ42]MDD1793775.1 DUF1826 domain-containing protein [Enterovibrio sp. ZSDZ42]